MLARRNLLKLLTFPQIILMTACAKKKALHIWGAG